MPFPSTAGALYFNDSNVTEFLMVYEDMCKNYQILIAEKLHKLPQYYESLTSGYIHILAEFVEKDYSGLIEVLKVEYQNEDLVQQMHIKTFLETLKNRSRNKDADIRSYCRQFAAISKRLMREGKLDAYTQR